MSKMGVNIAILEGGKVLLTLREDFEVWCLPGGLVDAGETIPEAAIREMYEETGLEVELQRQVGIYSIMRQPFMGHVVCFSAKVIGGELHAQIGEVLDIDYFDTNNLPENMMWWHLQRIHDVVHGVTGAIWKHSTGWNLPENVTRDELYRLRDASGLPRAEFYRQYLAPAGADICEVRG